MKKNIRFLRIIALMVVIGLSMTACGGGSSGKTFADVGKVEDWLASQKGGGSPDDPIPFSVKTNLQNMASAESNWQKLLTSIDTAGLYVALDLSGCTMPTTEFDADGGITKGKKFIVSLVLPDSTESVNGVLYGHFENLKTARAKKIDYLIGNPGPAGGFVFYDKGEYSDGWRYLEAAPEDMGTPLRWVSESFGRNYWSLPDVAGTGTGIGTGKNNTALILAVDPNAPAAKACAEYRGGGYDDWFLPSIEELRLMYNNLNNLDSFEGFSYWSSSQAQSNKNHAIYYDGSSVGALKIDDNPVRAVRAF